MIVSEQIKRPMKRRVIIDCDVGVDDALAMILAFRSPELEVAAVTGVTGNVPLDLVERNIRRVLSLIRPANRPLIARGADRPLMGTAVHEFGFHGADGLGEVSPSFFAPGEWWQTFPGSAHELITAAAREHPGELTLIAIGPLTNLALALRSDPDGFRQLHRVIVMGGAVRTKGNVTPHAEFNFFADPLAAQEVLASPVPLTLVPLDITRQVRLTPRIMEERVKPIGSVFSRFVLAVTGFDPRSGFFRRRWQVFTLHDPLAIGVAIDGRLVAAEMLGLSVETRAGERYGQTLEIGKGRPGKTGHGPGVNVCLNVHGEQFLKLFLSSLEG